MQVFRRKQFVERLYAQFGQQGVGGDGAVGGVMPEHGAESAWVVQKKTGVAENPFGVVMFTAIFVGRSSAQGTGPAQMDDLRAMIEIDQQVLAPAFPANYLDRTHVVWGKHG